MEYSAFQRISSEFHWLSKATTRKLTHAVHCKNLPPSITAWSLKGPICDCCVLYLPEGLFILAQTADELLLLREANQSWLELRIEPSRNVTAPYICKEGESIYISYVLAEEGQLCFIVKHLRSGNWRSHRYEFPQGACIDELQCIKAAYILGADQELHGLFQLRSKNRAADVLMSVRVSLFRGHEAEWQELFQYKGSASVWSLSLARDEHHRLHASWGIQTAPQQASYYYCSLSKGEHEKLSSQYVWKHEDSKVRMPAFLFGSNLLLLLFIDDKGHMVYGSSLTEGRSWQGIRTGTFGPEKVIQFVQMTKHSEQQYYPALVLGLGYPAFRPLEWFDLQPLLSDSCDGADGPDLSYIQAQLSSIRNLLSGSSDSLLSDVIEFVSYKGVLNRELMRWMEQWKKLDQEEQALISSRLPASKGTLEHLPLRHIR
ncbi:hypothetical protein [Paenibacillus sp. 1001270B_150601_E10]|uniref:hypothetical protein n=1 Tax=Paenibacillus sp. 1001270B_150601_E10 TaxID=2787079 RepID=UPI00189E93A5|nr:hypothetical protein [Paenibacillus sp. 1001270B_150601_E10]